MPVTTGSLDAKILINATECSGAGHTTTVNAGGHIGLYFRGLTPPSGAISGGYFEALQTTPGKDTIIVQNGTEAVTEPFFQRDDDAGAPVDLFVGFGKPVLVDGDVLGKITGGLTPRSVKTKAGGALSVWLQGTTLILCDDLAPPKDGLTDCSVGVRAP